MPDLIGHLFPAISSFNLVRWFGRLGLRSAAGAGRLGFPVLPGKPRAPQAPECVYSGAGATPIRSLVLFYS